MPGSEADREARIRDVVREARIREGLPPDQEIVVRKATPEELAAFDARSQRPSRLPGADGARPVIPRRAPTPAAASQPALAPTPPTNERTPMVIRDAPKTPDPSRVAPHVRETRETIGRYTGQPAAQPSTARPATSSSSAPPAGDSTRQIGVRPGRRRGLPPDLGTPADGPLTERLARVGFKPLNLKPAAKAAAAAEPRIQIGKSGRVTLNRAAAEQFGPAEYVWLYTDDSRESILIRSVKSSHDAVPFRTGKTGAAFFAAKHAFARLGLLGEVHRLDVTIVEPGLMFVLLPEPKAVASTTRPGAPR